MCKVHEEGFDTWSVTCRTPQQRVVQWRSCAEHRTLRPCTWTARTRSTLRFLWCVDRFCSGADDLTYNFSKPSQAADVADTKVMAIWYLIPPTKLAEAEVLLRRHLGKRASWRLLPRASVSEDDFDWLRKQLTDPKTGRAHVLMLLQLPHQPIYVPAGCSFHEICLREVELGF